MGKMIYERLSHLVGKMIRGSDFNRRGQVENNLLLEIRACLAPCSLDRLTYLQRELRLSLRERLRAVFISELCAVLRRILLRQLSDNLGVLDRKSYCLLSRIAEDDLTEHAAGCIVHVNDDMLSTSHRLHCPSDEILPGRGQDLDSSCFNIGSNHNAIDR